MILPLRDAAAENLVRALLDAVGPALMLAFPALAHVEIEVDGVRRVLTAEHTGEETVVTADGVPERWRTAAADGVVDPALLAGRPAEERRRPWWSVRWAIPVGDDGVPMPLPDDIPRVVHAPTPSDERLGLPALLLASFPLAPDRRHVAPGPLTDFIVARAADVYADLLRALSVDPAPGRRPHPALLDLVPGLVAEGELDARIRRSILDRLPETPFLPCAADPGIRVRPRDAVVVADAAGGGAAGPALVEVLTPVLPGLLPAGWPARHPAYAALGVRRIGLDELVDLLAGLRRDPGWWRKLYAALAGADPDALSALPVPLADGRLVRGSRGLLILPGKDPAELAPLAVRVVHPEAVHPLLVRLGAVEAGPRAVLDDPATRAAVAASYDEDDPEPIARAVLDLVDAAGITSGELPWLGDLALRGDDGDLYPAGELLLPDGPLARVVADDAPFGLVAEDLVARYGARTLEAVGVLRTFALLRAEDVPLDAPGLDLDDEDAWVRDTRARLPDTDVPPVLPELLAVRDLEFVDEARWDEALALLLAEPPLRDAVVEPARVLLPDGRAVDVPSYTAWWLRHHARLGGRPPGQLRIAGGDPLLTGLYDPAPDHLDAQPAQALGVRTSLAGLLAEPGGPDELLARLAEPDRPVGRAQLRALWAALAEVEPERVTPPERVRAVRGDAVLVADAEDTVVVDAPDLVPLLAGRPLVLVGYDRAARLADLLALPLASEEVADEVRAAGTRRQVPDTVRRVFPDAPAHYREHRRLRVDGVEVTWRYVDGVIHAATPGGLARGLAWAMGRWEARHLIEALIRDPQGAPVVLAEADLDRAGPDVRADRPQP